MSALHRVALVTGASSGIGLELAKLLAADGYDLLLVARSAEPLRDLALELGREYSIDAHYLTQDLTEPAAADTLWSGVARLVPTVDVLVNSAGMGLYGPLAKSKADAVTRMLDLNVGALTRLTQLALPGMIERGWGRVLNVASLAGTQPGGPRMATYYASKAYVLSLSRGLARELHGTGVTVTALCPGPTATEFERVAGAERTVLYTRFPAMDAGTVARAAYRGMRRGATVVTPGLLTKLLAFAGGLPPRFIAIEVNRWLLSKA